MDPTRSVPEEQATDARESGPDASEDRRSPSPGDVGQQVGDGVGADEDEYQPL